MMMVIPTCVVTIEVSSTESLRFRVPQTNLEDFIHVLLFNAYTNFSVSLERTEEV